MTKHVHYESIIEWAKDPSHPWQFKNPNSDKWLNVPRCCNPEWLEDCEYRKKPREFKDGYWYPIVTKGGRKMVASHNGLVFHPPAQPLTTYTPDELVFIGEGFKPDFGDN